MVRHLSELELIEALGNETSPREVEDHLRHCLHCVRNLLGKKSDVDSFRGEERALLGRVASRRPPARGAGPAWTGRLAWTSYIVSIALFLLALRPGPPAAANLKIAVRAIPVPTAALAAAPSRTPRVAGKGTPVPGIEPDTTIAGAIDEPVADSSATPHDAAAE